ncbi:hypothetical protein AmDm5_3041 [Acetobacter malorum]|nr:hypothetical protein AmDm5_3041 [Acetobacter malorum]
MWLAYGCSGGERERQTSNVSSMIALVWLVAVRRTGCDQS